MKPSLDGEALMGVGNPPCVPRRNFNLFCHFECRKIWPWQLGPMQKTLALQNNSVGKFVVELNLGCQRLEPLSF